MRPSAPVTLKRFSSQLKVAVAAAQLGDGHSDDDHAGEIDDGGTLRRYLDLGSSGACLRYIGATRNYCSVASDVPSSRFLVDPGPSFPMATRSAGNCGWVAVNCSPVAVTRQPSSPAAAINCSSRLRLEAEASKRPPMCLGGADRGQARANRRQWAASRSPADSLISPCAQNASAVTGSNAALARHLFRRGRPVDWIW